MILNSFFNGLSPQIDRRLLQREAHEADHNPSETGKFLKLLKVENMEPPIAVDPYSLTSTDRID